LEHWLGEVLGAAVGALVPASTDASFRRYWRFTHQGDSLIAVDAPPEHEDSARFARLARAFRAAGLNAPEVLAEDHRRGYLVVSDLGSRTYLAELMAAATLSSTSAEQVVGALESLQQPVTASTPTPTVDPLQVSASGSGSASALASAEIDRLYGDAIAALIKLQRALPTDELPRYDAAFLSRELELFRHWLLGEFLGLELSVAEQAQLEQTFGLLIESALEQPQVAVHRDYHSRNLMLTPAENPGVLDLQDAVAGPISYDLASLLKDCYIAWPRERVLGWVEVYADQAQAAGLLSAADRSRLVPWFDLMGAQRHLKAAGIFARLAVRDGKRGYLADLPRTLGYLRELGPSYPALRPLAALIDQRILPGLSAR
jgi:aminoglycoside/choline kinase family phosphotransferase